MAILEKEVLITLTGNNIDHFENIGYKIPKYVDSQGRLKVKRGTKIQVNVNDLVEGSKIKLTKVCDENNCGKYIPNQPYQSIIQYRKRGDGKDRCFRCGSEKSKSTRKNIIKYENSLEYFAINIKMEYLLDEFSSKNEKKPKDISRGTHDHFLWKCPKCESEYPSNVLNRTSKKSTCPYCCIPAQKVNHTNCIWTTNPEIAKLLKHPQRGYEITAGYNKKEDFVCPDCEHEQSKNVQNVVNCRFACEKCSDGMSYPEKFMINFLGQLNIYFETQKVFNWSKRKRYDFYIPDLSIIIETHGEQHYRNTGRGRTLEEEQQNDLLKEKVAKENNIKNYVVVDCRISELEHMKNSICNSKLEELFKLIGIDWSRCHDFAIKSNLLKEICELWNSGIKSALDISNNVKLGRGAVVKYLKRGTDLGLCDYNPKEVLALNGIENGKKSTKKVIQLSINGEFIKEWNSLIEAARELEINNANITTVCKGRYQSAGGFKWMYSSDYKGKKLHKPEVI